MVDLYLDRQQFDRKPSKKETEKITNRICDVATHIQARELASALSKGRTMLCAIMKNNRRLKANFLYQEIVALDFDGSDRLEDIKNDTFIQKNASFIYTTFNHTDNSNRFRVIFILNERLTSNEQVSAMYEKLFELYPNVDKSCRDSSRLFYGGTKYIEINFNNVLNVDEIISNSLIATDGISEIEIERYRKLQEIESKPTWWLIRHNHDDIVKSRLCKYKASVESQAVAMNYFNSLNMREVLGFKKTGNVHDLFSNDDKPSVSIFKMADGGVYLYKRHSNDPKLQFTGNLIQVIAKLKKTHFIGALNYLIEVTETDFNASEIIKNFNAEIDIYTSLLNSIALKHTSPNVYKIFKDGRSNYSNDVIQILQIFKNNVIEIDNEIRMITQLSSRELSLMIYGTIKKKDRILKVLNLMTTTDWIAKLEYNDIPLEIRDKVKLYQEQKGRKYHKNIFEFIGLDGDFFEQLENKCSDLVQNNFSAKTSLTKIGLQNTLGKNEADKVFTQDKSREVNEVTKQIEIESAKYILKQIELKGYVEERQVINHLSDVFSKSFSEFKFKQVRNSIVKTYDLEKVRLNKELKKEFEVMDQYSDTQAPSIFKRKSV